MEINKYIDWSRMWEDAKKLHLENFPTLESYQIHNEGIIADLAFAEEMYDYLLNFKEMDKDTELNSDEFVDYLSDSNIIIFDFDLNQSISNESGTQCGGYTWSFWFNKKWHYFEHFEIINHW